MNSGYFKGKVEQLETRDVPYRKRIGFFKYAEGLETKFYVNCSISAIENFLFRIEVTEEDFKQIKVGQNVSIHLEFSFEYVCWHFPRALKPKIVEVKHDEE